MKTRNELIQHLYASAITMGLVTVSEIITIYKEEGEEEYSEQILARLDEIAEANQHSNSELRSRWIRLRDAIRHYEATKGPIVDDKFGFKADARAKSTVEFHRNGFDLNWEA